MNQLLPGLYIKTFGCQMNEYDSSKLATILEDKYRVVLDPEEAELILINTCSVREKPAQKLFSLLGELRPLKKNPKVLIGVGGCVAQQEGKAIVERSSVVDFVFGTHNLSLVPSLIELRQNGGLRQVAVDYRDEWEDLPLGFAETKKVSVFVSISRGCNKKCSFCIVPMTRGPEVSRSPEEIKKEAMLAVRRGAKEITLLGQNVNSFGRDLKNKLTFVQLLEELSRIEGLERIRFTSPHPQEVREDFIEHISSNLKICRHIHMPLQSGSDRVLKAMRRSYKKQRYLDIIFALKERVLDLAVTTDIIVGFPGETEADFNETLDVMNQVRFESSFSFMFSPRPGTLAATMPGQVPEEERLRRLQFLQLRQAEIMSERLASWVGKTGEILVEGRSPANERLFQGRLSQNIVVNLEQEYEGLEPGMIIPVQVTSAGKHTLKGFRF